ncbi:MAG: thiamine-phosphate kinase [Nitrospirae bacterium]|nr:thiamine-phosphate kinase [Nitrospirota bacterium]
MSDKSSLSYLGEFGLIEKIRNKSSSLPPEVLKGIGDDAAAVNFRAGKVLMTTDMLLEGIHFDLSFTTYYQLGHKTVAVNVSDIFAMGGIPKYFLLSVGIPKNSKPGDIDDLYSGIREASGRFGVSVIGGDTCASENGLVLSGTLVGHADKIILRSGAREGDNIFVTNTLGDSAMGLFLLQGQGSRVQGTVRRNRNGNLRFKNLNSRHVLTLIKKHLMPEPAAVRNTSRITSMIDISDGLLIDLSHICDESNTGAIIYRDSIPISRELSEIAGILGEDPMRFALTGGEDYALLFTSPSKFRTNAVKIGKIIRKGRYIADSEGRKMPFAAEGYEHFKIKY